MSKIFIIAEAGVNHNGSIDQARRLIDSACKAGADAVKFQAFRAESLVTKSAEKASYQSKNLNDPARSQFSMLQSLEFSEADFRELKQHADRQEIRFLVTPFDKESADFIEPLVPLYKISSGDLTNSPFLKHIASKRKPMILSTGMANLEEITEAVEILRGSAPLTLLHCTTNYPCPLDEVNLNAMQTLREKFGLPVGYSDHTTGWEIPVAAAALGATVIEKHFTLDRELPGPDHKASLTPHELADMVRKVRNIEKALGDGIKKPQPSEVEIAKAARRSLVFCRPLKAGSTLSENDITCKRPGTGLPPSSLETVIGKKIKRDVGVDEPVLFDLLD